jgi:hypothetical protein
MAAAVDDRDNDVRRTAIMEYRRGENRPHSALMFAAFMIGHHFSISAF